MNGGWAFVERVSLDDFTLREVQIGMALSKHSDLLIYDIENQENYPGRGKEIVGHAVALRHSEKGDYILTFREDFNSDDDVANRNRHSGLIPSTIGQQTIRAFGYLLSRSVLLPDAEKQSTFSYNGGAFWIFVRVSETKAIAAIVRHGDLHGNGAAYEFRAILDRFHDIVYGNPDDKDSALTQLDYVTGRIVLNEEYKK